MPIHLFYELNKYEDISYADPLRPWGGQRPPRPPLDAHAVPVQNFQIQRFGKIFVITQMGIGHTKCRNPPLFS